MNAIRDLLTPTGYGYYYWLGATDADQDGVFVWLNSGEEASYNNFPLGLPPTDQVRTPL